MVLCSSAEQAGLELVWASVSTVLCNEKACRQIPYILPKEHLLATEFASRILKSISRSAASGMREVKPRWVCCIWFWALQFKGDMSKLEEAQQRVTRMVGSGLLAL